MSHFMSRLFGAAPEPGWLTPSELAARLQGDTAPLVVDVRGPDEFIGPLGHIAGAINLPLDQVPQNLTTLQAHQRPIVLVCHTDRRSSAAAAMLRAAGVTEVSVLRGGMVGWRQMPPDAIR